uniref:Uncharacterized protein n=1 Tax=Glossina brevipalpis TaxID=37001 RepID=A0A1A9W8F0_9MUSC
MKDDDLQIDLQALIIISPGLNALTCRLLIAYLSNLCFVYCCFSPHVFVCNCETPTLFSFTLAIKLTLTFLMFAKISSRKDLMLLLIPQHSESYQKLQAIGQRLIVFCYKICEI